MLPTRCHVLKMSGSQLLSLSLWWNNSSISSIICHDGLLNSSLKCRCSFLDTHCSLCFFVVEYLSFL